jgi:hypothetical protein
MWRFLACMQLASLAIEMWFEIPIVSSTLAA